MNKAVDARSFMFCLFVLKFYLFGFLSLEGYIIATGTAMNETRSLQKVLHIGFAYYYKTYGSVA